MRCLVLLIAVSVFAQPAFEVAFIKPSPPSGHLGYLTYPGGRVNFGHCILEMLIEFAFDAQAFQISGGPGWLHTHRETSNGPVYFLTKGKKPLKLQTPKTATDFPWVGSPNNGDVRGDGIGGSSVSMPILAFKLSQYMGRPVLDRTGIKGLYDFEYRYVSDDPHPNVISTIITSVDELGLKLKSGKGPVDRIVIDRAWKPSPN